jgi:uncharacterized protein (TIGR03067 family)
MLPIAIAVLSLTFAAPAKDPLTPALKALQGEWQAISVEEKGKKWNKDETSEVIIEILGDVLIYKRDTPFEKFRIAALESTKKPALMDLKLIAENTDPNKACHIIYELDDGKLKLCLASEFTATDSDQRPSEFATGGKRPPQGKLMFVMERIKK